MTREADSASRLRTLVFNAEQCDELIGSDAQGAWLRLQMFLVIQGGTDVRAAYSSQRLQQLCQEKLVKLQGQSDNNDMSQALAVCGCAEGFLFSSSQGASLLDRLSIDDSFKTLLETGAPQRPPQENETASLHGLRVTSDRMRDVLTSVQPSKHTTNPQKAKVQLKQSCIRPSFLPADSAANQHPSSSTTPTSRYSDMHKAGQMVPALQEASLDRKRDAEGRLRKENQPQNNAGGASVYSHAPVPSARRRIDQKPDNVDADDDAIEEDDLEKERCGSFMTAKGRLIENMRKKGQTYRPSDHTASSSQNSGQPCQQKLPPFKKPAAAGQKRSGALAPFRPPYKTKGSNEEEGEMSAKSLEMLAGPDGELPEALQKMEPAMLELVCNEIVEQGGHVQWNDIAGQEQAKRLVQELVVWPMLNPHLFKGARAPAKGLLLFGPPGTGKTLIGKAIASNIKATFFNISASSLTSKWIGQGEKMVRALFAVAGCMQPAVIFVDEIDSILSARKSEGEHEASRRLKTEMLVQMEGCDPSSAERRVLLVGATNRPEELDEAARRRMPKQLYIPLPCAAARRQMIDRQLGSGSGIAAQLSDTDLVKIVAKTDGYSGSDMRNLIQEACQGPVRNAMGQAAQLSALAQLSEADLRPVILKDFQMAAKAQRASVEPAEVVRYEEYDSRHGARYVDADADAAEMDEDW